VTRHVQGTLQNSDEKNEHRTSNVQHRMLNDDETEELIKIFVTSIKTAENKKK